MAEKLKIKLSIANRVYPLTIIPNQEEGLRKAAQKIDAMIKQFEQSYSVRDKQDVLAMCALQFASQTEQKTIDIDNLSDEVEHKLDAIDQLLKVHLNSEVL
jgi:cell division protein ZapA